MALILPNLDDKTFEQIVDEARLIIPSTSPEWTDHNVHDPGITFTELFAWLAEIAHYRLNRTSAASYERFFSLMGVTPLPARAAEVSVALESNPLPTGLLVPANSKMTAIGIDTVPFQTLRDQYLTKAKVNRVVTVAGGLETVQTTAEKNEVGHYEAFGQAPAIGDFLRLEFEDWFDEPQGQLEVTLFEDDLTARKPLPAKAAAFEPSATIRWEFRSDAGGAAEEEWTELDVLHDETLSLSRSGYLIFRSPAGTNAANHKQLRAVLTAGKFEIPPRIVSVRTNTVRARQVETIVNEPLKASAGEADSNAGLGTADQVVRVAKWPVFVNTQIDDGPFQVGEVLDWTALIGRLREANVLYKSPLKETVLYLADKLNVDLQDPPTDDPLRSQEYALAQAFETLLEDADLYQASKFVGLEVPAEFTESGRCKNTSSTRRLNRLLLQKIFPDLFVSDRIEVQVGVPAATVKEEVKTWQTWKRVDDFQKSTPDDQHYMFDAETGTIQFGNGMNGRVPQTTELIRARFYRHSKLEQGNLTANHQWRLDRLPPGTSITNATPAAGGRRKETMDETRIRTREVFRKEHAVLTGTDYETLALNTPGLRVTRAKVIPNFSPKFPCLKLPGEVTLIVEPQPPPRAAFPSAPPTLASEGFLSTIQNAVESRRIVTTNIHVIGPRYLEVNVSGRVFLKKRVSEAEALESIKRALAEFLDPVLGGPERGKGWPFGRSIFPSEISQQLTKVAGVDYVTKIAINDLAPGEALKMPYDGLPTSGRHAITTVAFENRGQESIPPATADCIQQQGKNCG